MKRKIILTLILLCSISCFLIGGCAKPNDTPKVTHTLVFVKEVPATEDNDGVSAHYVCSDCNLIFADAEGLQETTLSKLIIPKLPEVNHALTFVEKVPATERATGVKAHYKCSRCDKLFLDGNGTIPVTMENLTILYRAKDGNLSLNYVFDGAEKTEKGFAEGKITLSSSVNFNKDDNYDFYFGYDDEILDGYYPVYSYKIQTSSTKSISFDLSENTFIPQSANQIIVYKNGLYSNGFDIDADKLLPLSNCDFKYAIISDVHTNYNQGEKHLLNTLNQFETLGVQYVIISGDIGESNADYEKYANACEQSSFSGLIFAALGNHDQTTAGRINFSKHAIYNGNAKQFVKLEDMESYFSSVYDKKLPVTVHYKDLEGNGKTYYYYVEIGNNVYFFMDLMLGATGDANDHDCFSKTQLDYLESVLYNYSDVHSVNAEFKYDKYNLFIVEHAPFEQLKVGDTFTPRYGGQMQLENDFVNNNRLFSILQEYYEAIMITGHTHVQYDVGINYIDRVYDKAETLTDVPLARTFHVSSVAQPRWYDYVDGKYKMQMKNDYSAGSESYIVYQYGDYVVLEGNSFKEYTPDCVTFDQNLYGRNIHSAYTYIIKQMTNKHLEPVIERNFATTDYAFAKSGSPTVSMKENGLALNFGSVADGVIFKLGKQSATSDRDYWIELTLNTTATSFDLSSCDYSGNKKITKRIDLSVLDGDGYLVTDKGGNKIVQIKINTLMDGSIKNEFAVLISNVNAVGEMIIPNFVINSQTDFRTRGKSFSPSADFTIDKLNGNSTLSFDYRIDNDGEIKLALLDSNWGNYYGYFTFNKDGEKSDYVGVTTTKLGDGYIRVTFALAELNLTKNKYNRDNAPSSVGIFYVRGRNGYNTAIGYIDNITCS